MSKKILYVDNRVEYVLSHRIPWLEGARDAGLDVHVTTLTDGPSSRIEDAGFAYHDISEPGRSNNPLRELKLIVRLYRLYRELQPDIIHHITLRSILYGGVAAAVLRDPKIVNGVTGLGYLFSTHEPKIQILRTAVLWALRLLTRRGGVYLFQNPDDERLFQQHQIVDPSSSVLIKGSGVDTDAFKTREEAPGPPVVLFPARMLWHKGVQAFVNAARMLKQDRTDVRFVMVGDTDADNPAGVSADELEQWEDEGILEWWGYQEHMADVFAQSHIVCLPSAYREGVPKVLIEAASCGRPIVTTDMPGCREIVRDGENGILVPPRDGRAVAEAVRRLVRDGDLRRHMGERGRKRVRREFSIEHVVASTVEVYRKLLADPNGGYGGQISQEKS
ncbi:glycosyltransferase family 4 protein [Salinibacter sp.]|uniref:glycosyltransferase family 4 protein n=1 Tax=Salinibacter sp. TaxID=2065818 RepID=UPI0021E8E292|nr:glycosyltransferase family 4 protein [Salinibacter sp.]